MMDRDEALRKLREAEQGGPPIGPVAVTGPNSLHSTTPRKDRGPTPSPGSFRRMAAAKREDADRHYRAYENALRVADLYEDIGEQDEDSRAESWHNIGSLISSVTGH